MISIHIRGILIVTGLLTMGALTAILIPSGILKLLFGVEQPDVATVTIVRHWGLLVALVGSLLVFAGYHPDVRVPAMTIGAIEKLAIAAFVLASPLRRRRFLLMMVTADTMMAILYLIALS